MFGAWLYVGSRLQSSASDAQQPVRMFHKFFLFMAIFMVFMWLPNFWLALAPERFPLAMAIGYVVGHVFLYIAFSYIARMTCRIVPRLNSKEKLVTIACYILSAVITAITAMTMIWGKQPAYDYIHGVTLLNASPIVGPSIGIFALLTVIPAAILFMIHAFKSQGSRRVRSLLLGIGLFVLMTGGPLHDNATTSTMYIIADISVIAAMLVVGVGVVYRLEQSLAFSEPTRPVMAPSSNTV